MALPPFAAAGDVTLAWDANTEPELLGYFLCYGTSSGNYSVQVDVGNVTQHEVSDLAAGTYYFAVKAYGIEGLESAFSNEVSATVAESDVQAPTISGVSSSSVTTTGATVSWTTNEAADTQVEYGTSISYGTSSTLNSTLSTSHSQSLTGLTSSTTYHYRVKSRDAAGNLATSGDYTFTTATPADITPPTISGVSSSSVTTTGATVSWTTNEAADTQVEYGTSISYGSSSTLNSTLSTSHSQSLTGLTSSTTYHYRVKSRDAAGNLATSGDYTFTTATPADITPPTISGVSSSSVTTTGATVSWTTNEAADTQVEYGTSISYGTSSTLNSTLSTSHSQSLSGLTSSTTYHYRVKSRDAAGNLATSENFTFTTVNSTDDSPPYISNVKTSKISGIRATITWDTNEEADSDVEYGTTTDYGTSVADSGPRGSRTDSRSDLNSSRPKNRVPDSNTTLVTSHSLNLNDLTPGNIYHFRVKSRDAAGNLGVSADYTFVATAAGDIVTGLAAAYTFDEGSGTESSDYSENGNTAVLHSTEWAEGKYGRAVSFNGTNSYIAAGTQGLPDTNQPHTISFWVSTKDAKDADDDAVRHEPAGTMLSLANAELKASLRHGYKNSEAGTLDYENQWAVVGSLPAPRTWHHFGYIFDGAQNSLFMDGKLVSTSTIQPPAAPVTSFEIGRWIDGSAYFQGSIDDVRVYSRALTEEQLRLAMITPVAGSGAAAHAARHSRVEDRVAVLETAAPRDAKPVIAMQLEQRAYGQGETVRTRELWISNPSAESRNAELRTWIELPGMQPISLGGLGIGEKVRLVPGFNQNYGVLPLMEISDDAPDGTCRFGVRLVDPVTGEVLSESIKSFRIGGGKTGRAVPETAIESRLEGSQLQIENKGALAAEIEVKMWFEAPDGSTLPAFSTELILPAGAEITLAAPAATPGLVLRTRILHSSSGKTLATNCSNYSN